MKVLYAKAALYSYAHLEAIAEQLDEIVEKKAFSSSMNFSPALNQFEEIIGLTALDGSALKRSNFPIGKAAPEV